MKLLPSADYENVRPLFADMPDHLAVQVILEGIVAGHVYVDHPARPQVAVAWIKRRLHLAGSPAGTADQEWLHRLFVEEIYAQARADHLDALTLYYTPTAWEPVLEAGFLPGAQVLRVHRQFYACHKLQAGWRSMLPTGFTLHPVDAALLFRSRLQYLDDLRTEICSERSSVAEFLANSFGVCAVRGYDLAGWCLSEYNTATACEVGIETREPHRRLGLGTAMTLALVEEALKRGMSHIGWHCYANNVASVATALRAGFVKVRDYPSYVIRLRETD